MDEEEYMTSERFEEVLERVFEGQRVFLEDNPFLSRKGYKIVKDGEIFYVPSLLKIADFEPIFDLYVLYVDVNGAVVIKDYIRVK